MQLHLSAVQLVTWVTALTDPIPKDEDVKAGWTAFVIFIGLIVAVALLGWSLVRQLRKAQAAEEAGVYGHDEDDSDDGPAESDGADEERPADHQS